ncbi:MAG: LysM peptidoglycan-binding domain-containing protein [Victivallaceae bacterium]
MKKIYAISALAFLGILAVGCKPELASSELNQTEAEWYSLVKSDYPGWGGPAVVAPNKRVVVETATESDLDGFPATVENETVTIMEPGAETMAQIDEVEDDELIAPAIDETTEVATESEAETPAVAEYVVKKGDSLEKIARKFYGNGDWKPIVAANPKYFKNGSTVVKVGTKLAIPQK